MSVPRKTLHLSCSNCTTTVSVLLRSADRPLHRCSNGKAAVFDQEEIEEKYLFGPTPKKTTSPIL